MLTCYKNVRILSPSPREESIVVVDGGKILGLEKRIDNVPGMREIDGGGMYLSPGFIDMHVHGGGGFSVMSANADDIVNMCKAHARNGTTSILPTTLAAPIDMVTAAARAVISAKDRCSECNILGVHLEGPFLSPAQSGAQNPEWLLSPDGQAVDTLLSLDGIKMMGAAPELSGGLELGKRLIKKGIIASIAHSDADYGTVERAVGCGYSDVTHIYSGCSMVYRKNSYRIAGVVEAGLSMDELTVQVIADLRHLPVSLLRLIVHCTGAGRISLISDGLEFSASTLNEGVTYTQANGM